MGTTRHKITQKDRRRRSFFGECAELVRETALPSSSGTTPYIGLQYIGEGTLSLVGSGLESEVKSITLRFEKGDILFGRLRPYFRKVVVAPFDGICSTDIWVVRAVKGVYQGFLYYNMASQSFVDFATSGSEGTRMPRASWEHVSRYELSIPSFREQRALAHVLRKLDDKIELNRRMCQTLEEMAQALFKSWFVDFDPVRAKMDGRWLPGESLPGLPAHLYDLFPDRLVDSELGPIPEGWKVGPLGKYFDLTMGQSPPSSTYNDSGKGLPFFQGRADFSFRYPGNRRFCTAPTRIVQIGDTLVSVRAPVGDINMALRESCIGRGIAGLRHKSGSSSYTYYCAKHLQPEIRYYENTGTVFGAITKAQFISLLVAEPVDKLVYCYEELALATDQRIRAAIASSDFLTILRDALLPKLVSGELRIPAVETGNL